jgi:hypothetical protein
MAVCAGAQETKISITLIEIRGIYFISARLIFILIFLVSPDTPVVLIPL